MILFICLLYLNLFNGYSTVFYGYTCQRLISQEGGFQGEIVYMISTKLYIQIKFKTCNFPRWKIVVRKNSSHTCFKKILSSFWFYKSYTVKVNKRMNSECTFMYVQHFKTFYIQILLALLEWYILKDLCSYCF